MSGFWLGVAVTLAIPTAAFLLWFVWTVGPSAVGWLFRRAGLGHWSLAGPQWRHLRPASELFRRVNVAGRHVATFRRLLAVGPFTLYVARYRPGNIEEKEN